MSEPSDVGAGQGAANTLPIEPRAQGALWAEQQLCQLRNRAFQTPNLLLALLHIKGGAASTCFNQLQPGLSETVRRRLQSYAATENGTVHEAHASADLPAVLHAQRLALARGQRQVEDCDLFAAVLATPSSTQEQLHDWLGTKYTVLMHHAAVAQARASLRTPGDVFGANDD